MLFTARWRPLPAAIGLTTGLLAGLASPVLADPAPPYAELLRRAQAQAPLLAETDADVARAEGLSRQGAARPNPTLALEVENFAGSGPFQGAKGAETTLSVQYPLELGGKRPARVAAGRAEVAAAQAKALLARADFAARLAVVYAEAEFAAAKAAQAGELLAAAEADATTARALVAAGREADLRSLQAATEQDAASAEQQAASASREGALIRLSALAGAEGTYDAVGDSLLNRPPAPPTAAAALSPAVTSATAERDAAAARVRRERVRSAPDVTVSAGVRRLELEKATAVVAGVSMPLPLFDRNQGAVAAAEAELRAAEARLRQAQLDAGADLLTARSQARSAAAQIAASTSAEQAAAEAYRLSRIGYEAGRLPLIELTAARRGLATAQLRGLDARLARVRAEAEIARLTGQIPFGD